MPPGPELRAIGFGLGNPLLSERYERLMREAQSRAPSAARAGMEMNLIYRSVFSRGRIGEALEAASQPDLPSFAVVRLQMLVAELGWPGELPELDQALQDARRGDIVHETAFSLGARAAAVGDDQAYATALATVRSHADSLLAAGDSAAATREHAAARALEAVRLRYQGELAEAARILEEVRPVVRDQSVTWWLAGIHRDLGNLREAERYYRPFLTWDPDPRVSYELGKLYDDLGEPDKARHMLEFFVTNWSDADPLMQPLVEDAKRRLVELRIG